MGNQLCSCCYNIYPSLITDDKQYLMEMQEYPKQILESIGSETIEHKHKASIEYYEQRRTFVKIYTDQDCDQDLRKSSCDLILSELQTRKQPQKSNSFDELMKDENNYNSNLSFEKVYSMHSWVEIPNCPGRYIIKKGICSNKTINELLQDWDLKIKFFENKNYRDKIGVVTFHGGAILTYCKNNNQFVHTLNNITGFKRKLNMLGIIYEEVNENLIDV